MTPAERALLIAIGEVLCELRPDLHLKECIFAVKQEDNRRPIQKKMQPMSREAYNARIEKR